MSTVGLLIQEPKEQQVVPMYQKVANYILDGVKTGKLQSGERLEQPKVLADELKVSVGTIRHSLQMLAAKGVVVRKPGNGTFISCENNRVMDTIGTHNEIIDIVLSDTRYPEYLLLQKGIQEVARENGLHVVSHSTGNNSKYAGEIIARQVKSNSFGMVFCIGGSGGRIPLESLCELEKSKIPAVCCLMDSLSGTNYPGVTCDIHHNIYIAAKHLCEVGCKRIALIAYGTREGEIYPTIKNAFMEALNDMGVISEKDLQLSLPMPSSFDDILAKKQLSYDVISEWLCNHPQLDGICCSYDRIAYVAMRALARHGRIIPDDVAVAGVGNIGLLYEFPSDELTSVDVKLEEMGRETCKLLIAMRNGEKIESGLTICIKGNLVQGLSTAITNIKAADIRIEDGEKN